MSAGISLRAQQKAPNPQPVKAATGSPGAGGDCCSPEAIKKTAAAASFLDIVGIKLGMTPTEATAALKAYNANLKIDVINTRLEHPSNPGTFVRVPRFIVAHTVPWDARNGKESIALGFTTPPSPAVLAS